MARDLNKEFAERMAKEGWKLLPNGQIAFLPFIASATFPMVNGLAVALRFEARRTGPDDNTPGQLQLGLTSQQCRDLAPQLLKGAEYLEREMTPPDKGQTN